MPDATDPDDAALLHDLRHDRAAFGAIVDRYGAMVRAAARRHVRDEHLADDVAQATFVLLARRAASIPADRSLAAWLLTTTRLVAMNARRQRDRARRWELAMANEPRPAPGIDDLSEYGPLVDEALARLGAADRDAIVWRYVDGLPLAMIGARQGTSDEAARKRVGRAVERVRAFLRRRGVRVGDVGGTIGAVVTSGGALPPEVRTTLAHAGSSAASPAAISLTKGVFLMTVTAKTTLTIVGSLAALLLIVGGTASVVLLHRARDAAPLAATTRSIAATMAAAVQPSVTFGDGSVATLAGVRVLPVGDGPAGPWRDAAGAPLTRPWTEPKSIATFFRGFGTPSNEAQQAIELRVDFANADGVADHGVNVQLARPATFDARWTQLDRRDRRGSTVYAMFGVEAGRVAAELKIGHSRGEFAEYEAIAPGDAAPRRVGVADDLLPELGIVSIGEADGHAVARTKYLHPSPIYATLDWRFDVMLRDGKRENPDRATIDPDGVQSFTFAAALADVDHVALRYRPVEWRSLGAIRLAPTTTPATKRSSE